MGRHIVLRGNIWWFRKRIPSDLTRALGKTFIAKTLRTTDEKDAAKKARRLSIQFEELFEKERIKLGISVRDTMADLEMMLRPKSGSKMDTHVKNFMAQPHVIELSDKSKVNYNQVLRYFAEYFAKSDLSEITIKTCGDFKRAVMCIPARRSNNEAALSFDKIIKLSKLDPSRPVISAKRVQTLLSCVRTFLDWCTETGYIDFNPMTQIKVAIPKSEKATESRIPWTDKDLGLWFNSPVYRGSRHFSRRMTIGKRIIMDAIYWLPIVGLYTGARVEEVAMLTKRDLRKDKETGIWYFNISILDDNGDVIVDRSLKTAAAIRKVPIHSALFDLGFFKWANSHYSDNLFKIDYTNADGKWSGNFVKTFGRYKKGCGVTNKDMVFHSFRHMFIRQLKIDRSVDKYEIKQLVGHERGDDTTEGYGGDYPLDRMKELVEIVKVPINLDHVRELAGKST